MHVHIHTQIGLGYLYARLEKLNPGLKPLFGQMTCHQTLCHIGDLFRLANGTLRATEYGNIAAEKINAMAKSGKTVPVPIGLDQALGGGTQPTDFKKDLETLKQLIEEFNHYPDTHIFPDHPYFPGMNKQQWLDLINYHTNYHLEQFGV